MVNLMKNVIEIQGLSKSYGRIKALKNVNLNVPEGKIFGLIGPNGAGKTTLIKALVGSLKQTSGSIKVLGMDPLKNKWELRKAIGYMPQVPALYGDISARDNITFFGKAHNIPDLGREVQKLIEFTELEHRANDLVRNFSGGMQKRISLACALIHKPKILFLDEPTAAIDPNLKQKSWEWFRKLAHSGVTLFISTHIMDEALHCDKVTILREGEVLAENTPTGILAMGSTKVKILKNGTSVEKVLATSLHELVNELKNYGLNPDIESLSIEPDSLEEIILTLIKKKK